MTEITSLTNVEHKSRKAFGYALVDKNIMINKMTMNIMIEHICPVPEFCHRRPLHQTRQWEESQ